MPFQNSTIAIIGASGAIGTALARRLKSQHASLVLISRTPEKLAPLSAELDSPALALDQLNTPITGIVNCAGSILLKPAHLTTDDEWNQTMLPPKLTPVAVSSAIVKALQSGVEDVYPGDVAQEWLARWRDNPKALEREVQGG